MLLRDKLDKESNMGGINYLKEKKTKGGSFYMHLAS